MPMKSATKQGCTVNLYPGDAKTLLAFNLPNRKAAKNLAGFTIQVQPGAKTPYYLFNSLRFKDPSKHAQVATEPANSSINAPLHKFRWVHIPGTNHQGTAPFMGTYTYTVTPRFFDDHNSLLPLDTARCVVVSIDVVPFEKNGLKLGFTRGFTQSQAFVNHFGPKAKIRPAKAPLLFDTSAEAGTSPDGKKYTYLDEYRWSGFTARERIFELLNEVLAKPTLKVDVFAYDLNEPDLMALLLKLAKQGRIRIILDNAALHHNATKPKPEDEFEKLFTAAAKGNAGIHRARFGRYAHDKIFIVSNKTKALKILTGSTNFSVTGMYVNSNHILQFDDAKVAAEYSRMFDAVWNGASTEKKFAATTFATQTFAFGAGVPKTAVTFSPHTEAFAKTILDDLVTRIDQEEKAPTGKRSILFAVMELGTGTGPVFPALKQLHANERVFSYGISDTTAGISLYKPGTKNGVLVTGKPTNTKLPPPFSQVPGVGLGHQVHHKFIVCGFSGPDPTVFCGSSNLALGGEQANGDNLLTIRDRDVATAFVIEALALVDHFHFLNKVSSPKDKKPATKPQAAADAGWFLSTSDRWVEPYFDPKDLHSADRELFGANTFKG